jgi:adenosylcobinamide-phosphate guanylyltransferase
MEMDALIMAGGAGSRLGGIVEKPLLEISGEPIIGRVIEALKGSRIRRIFAATSQNTSKTAEYLRARGIKTIQTSGRGYVEDMIFALKALGLEKTLVISSDLPLITSEHIDWVIREYERQANPSLAVFIPLDVFRENNLTPSIVLEGYVPAGINIVDAKNLNGPETKLISDKVELAFNVNTYKEVELAERRLKDAHK